MRPDLESDEEAILCILEAVKRAGYEPGRDFVLALDAAASEWKGERTGEYILPKCGKKFTSSELTEHWKKLCETYPIYSIEDGLDEEDWEGWKYMTKELGNRIQLVGDDLFVTNTKRLKKGIGWGCGNSILIKPIRSERFQKRWKRSDWPAGPGTRRLFPTAPEKRRIQRSPIWQLPEYGTDQNRGSQPERTGGKIQPSFKD